MAVISNREQLINYCLRRLGEPVIEINVDEDQVEDRVDDALQVYREFHGDATRRNYYEHQITQTDVDQRFIRVPPRIISVTKMFPVSNSFIGSSNMFSFEYQFALSDFHSLNDVGGLAYYDQMRSYMELLDMKLNGLPMITWARRQNKLYLWSDIEDGQLQVGQWICAEVHRAVAETGEIGTGISDPTTILNDMFMKDYTTALIKLQWGINMSKFEGMQLPGGVTVNGRQLVDDANGELEAVRERMRLEQEEPPMFLVG